MLKLESIYYTIRGFDLLESWGKYLGKYNQVITWNKSMEQLAFLVISSTPSLKNIAQISSHSLWLNQLNFIVFCISTLTRLTPSTP